MKIMNVEECFDSFDFRNTHYFLDIDHSGHRQRYELFKIVNSQWVCVLSTDVKDELKIWLDLNGLKICDKIIVIKNNHNKFDIEFETFELKMYNT